MICSLVIGVGTPFWASSLYATLLLIILHTIVFSFVLAVVGYISELKALFRRDGPGYYILDMAIMILLLFFLLRYLNSNIYLFELVPATRETIAVGLVPLASVASVYITGLLISHSIRVFLQYESAAYIARGWNWLTVLTGDWRYGVILVGIIFFRIDSQNPSRLIETLSDLMIPLTLFIGIVTAHILLNPERDKLVIPDLPEEGITPFIVTAIITIGIIITYMAAASHDPLEPYLMDNAANGSLEATSDTEDDFLEDTAESLRSLPRSFQAIASFAIGAGIGIVLVAFLKMAKIPAEDKLSRQEPETD